MTNVHLYLVFFCLALILITARGDVCACTPCSMYKERHDRCECCRYIQNGKKRSEPLLLKHVNTKPDAISYFNFDNPLYFERKRAQWLPLPQFENPNIGPCSPARFLNDQENNGCVQAGSGLERADDLVATKTLLDNKESEVRLRHNQDGVRGFSNNRQITDYTFHKNYPEVHQDGADFSGNREELRADLDDKPSFGWKVSSRPDVFMAPVDDVWS